MSGGTVENGSRSSRLKGRLPPRPCPDDFKAKLIEIGRFACEAHYEAGRDTVTRWMGAEKDELTKARAAHVTKLRTAGEWMTRQTPLIEHRKIKQSAPSDVGPVLPSDGEPETEVDAEVVRCAAQFLRIKRNGGLMISPTKPGLWRVGLRNMTSAQIVDLAVSRGFDNYIGPRDGGTGARAAQ